MSLRDDLINISNNVSAVLGGCNMTLKPEASTLLELPARVGEMHNAAYDEGFDAGEASGLQRGEEFGRLRAWDEFWDAFQDNGNRTAYNNEFNGRWWNDTTFKPKYPLVVMGSARQMLYNCGALEIPVALDTSQATDLTYFACVSKFVELPVIDARGVPSTSKINSAVYNCPNLISVEKVYLHGGDWGDSFMRLPELLEIRFEGEFVTSMDFSYSSKLSRGSIESIYGALSYAGGSAANTITLSRTAVDKAFETADGANDGSTSAAWETLYLNTPWSTVLN